MQEGHVLGQPCQVLAVGLLLPYQSHMSGCLAKCCKAAAGLGLQSSVQKVASPKCNSLRNTPRASLEKTLWNGCFLVMGRQPALCELYSVPSGEMLINQWMGRGMMFAWGHIVYLKRKEVCQQITEQNPKFWPSFSHHIPKYCSCDEHFVCLWKASHAGIDQNKIKWCEEEQTVQVNKRLSRLTVLEENHIECTLPQLCRCAFWLWNLAVNLQNPQLFLNIA